MSGVRAPRGSAGDAAGQASETRPDDLSAPSLEEASEALVKAAQQAAQAAASKAEVEQLILSTETEVRQAEDALAEASRAFAAAPSTEAAKRMENASAALASVNASLASLSDHGLAAAVLAMEVAERAHDEAQRLVRYVSALEKSARLTARLEEQYPALVFALDQLKNEAAEAVEVVKIANRYLPAGADSLPDPESFRDRPAEAARTIATEIVELWVYEDNGAPVPEHRLARLTVKRDGRGVIAPLPGSYKFDVTYVRRQLFRQETIVAPRNRTQGARIANAVLAPLQSGEGAQLRTKERLVPIDPDEAAWLAEKASQGKDAGQASGAD